MKIFITLCIILFVNSQSVYDLWKRDQKRIYFSGVKNAIRKRAFEENINLINNVNLNSSNKYQLGLNEFADIPFRHFSNKYLGVKLPNRTKLREGITHVYPSMLMKSLNPFDLIGLLGNFSPNTAPVAVDYRKYSLAVQNQMECGSCWAFAAMGVFGL